MGENLESEIYCIASQLKQIASKLEEKMEAKISNIEPVVISQNTHSFAIKVSCKRCNFLQDHVINTERKESKEGEEKWASQPQSPEVPVATTRISLEDDGLCQPLNLKIPVTPPLLNHGSSNSTQMLRLESMPSERDLTSGQEKEAVQTLERILSDTDKYKSPPQSSRNQKHGTFDNIEEPMRSFRDGMTSLGETIETPIQRINSRSESMRSRRSFLFKRGSSGNISDITENLKEKLKLNFDTKKMGNQKNQGSTRTRRRYSREEVLLGVDDSAQREAFQQNNRKLSDFTHEVERLAKKQTMQDLLKADHHLVIGCDSNFRRRWDLLMVLLVIYVVVVIPVRIGFRSENFLANGIGLVFDLGVDFLFIIDILLNLRTSFVDERTKEEIREPRRIAHRYLKGFFFMDLVSSVPVQLIIETAKIDSTYTFVKLLRLVKIFRLMKATAAFVALEEHSNNPAIYRLVKVFIIFLLSSHFIACMYWYVRARPEFIAEYGGTLEAEYAYALYAAFGLLCGSFTGDAKTTIEYYFEVLYLFLGVAMNATIIGSAATIISQLDATAVAKKNQVDSVVDFMRRKCVPAFMQQRIRGYIEYTWDLGQSPYNLQLLDQLPPKLRLELNLMLKKDLVLKCPLLKTLPSRGTVALLQNLQTQIVLPNDLVVHQGELADSMFFISRGSVSVFHTVGNVDYYVTTLVEGSFFGEIGLLENSLKRTTSIVAETYCELQRLSSEHFKLLFDSFSDFHNALKTVWNQRLGNLKTCFLNTHRGRSGRRNGTIYSIHELALLNRRAASPLTKKLSKRGSKGIKKGSFIVQKNFSKAKNVIHATRVFAAAISERGLRPDASGSQKLMPVKDTRDKQDDDKEEMENTYLNLQVSHSMASVFQPGSRMDTSVARSFLSTPSVQIRPIEIKTEQKTDEQS